MRTSGWVLQAELSSKPARLSFDLPADRPGTALAGKVRELSARTQIMRWWTEQLLGSSAPRRRKAALEKAASCPGPRLEVWATAALTDPDGEVRLAAVQALARLPAERAAISLATAVVHQDPTVRQSAISSLARLPERLVSQRISEALRDTHDSVRTAAARALESLGWQPSSEAEAAALAVARHDFRAATQCGASAIECLLGVLADATYPDRRAVVLALTDLGDARITKALVAATRDPDPSVRTVAIERLGDRNEPGTVECIRAALRDENRNVRAAAVECLGQLGDADSLEVLLAACRDRHWEVRKGAIEALGKIGHLRAVPGLTAALNDGDHDVRMAAAEALGRFGCSEAISALVGGLVDAHAAVRRASETSLFRIDRNWERNPAAQKPIPKLKSALVSNEYAVRQAAASTLVRIGAEAEGSRQAPLTGLSHPAAQHRRVAMELFLECLADSDQHLRLAAVEALARSRDEAALGPLKSVAADATEDRWVRSAAQASLPLLAVGRPRRATAQISEVEKEKIVPLVLWPGDSDSHLRRLQSS